MGCKADAIGAQKGDDGGLKSSIDEVIGAFVHSGPNKIASFANLQDLFEFRHREITDSEFCAAWSCLSPR